MNRTISRLLASVLFVSSAFAATSSETNKTFIRMRDYRNRAEMATTFHKAASLNSDDRANCSFEIMPFYRRTYNGSKLGKGLGVNHKDSFVLSNGTPASNTTTAAPTGAEVDAGYIIHDNDATTGDYLATVTLKPRHYAFGANINLCCNLDNLVEGLYVEANTAVAKAYNKVGLVVSGETNQAVVTWITYFTGSANTVAEDKTGALTKAKLNYDTYLDKAGVEDPELLIGYNFVDSDSGKVSVNIGASAPTGTDPECEYTFEPLVGGRHFKLGLGLRACANLWDEESNDMNGSKKSLKAIFDLNYRYAFKRDVLMTPQLNVGGTVTNWGHYYVGGKAASTVTEIFPAANWLTQTYEVKPGNMFDGYAMISYSQGWFVGDLGVACEFKEAHTPTMKVTWDNATYYIADSSATINTGGFLVGEGDPVLKAHIINNVESSMLFKCFIGAGAVMDDWDYPVTFGLGADVDIASKQQITPECWKVFGKVGITF